MKKIVVSVMFFLLTTTLAYAEWLINFRDTFLKEGIDNAVVVAMKDGASPDMIVENGLQLEGLNPSNLVKALYCAGAQGKDIRAAAEKWQISELLVAAGYKRSIAECGDKVADSQPFTPVGTGTGFVSINPGGGGGGTPVSPSSFAP